MISIIKTAGVFLALFLLCMPTATGAYEKNGMKSLAISHTIDVTVDIEARKVTGKDRIALEKGTKEVRLLIREGSQVDSIGIDRERLPFTTRELKEERAVETTVKLPERFEGRNTIMDVAFHGTFPDVASAKENIRRGVAYVEDGVIGAEGVFLPSSSLWYPQEESGIALYDVTARLPEGYASVVEGEQLRLPGKRKNSSRWRTSTRVDGADLVAAKYAVEKEVYKGIAVYTYFFEKDPKLSRLYIEKTKGYLDLYQDMIGPYPFKKFAVVENFLPTGYGMPSFTLLGSAVLRLPFIPDTSLGHEIAHNWWGNSVFVDNSRGNWSEAITTYTADYLYARRGGEAEAKEFRFTKLLGYRNFAGKSTLSLKDFMDSTTTASRAVGYNKGVMVFNMLEDLLGPDLFEKGLKEFYRSNAFKRASWADIEAAFERSSGRDLKWFFDQWVGRGGGPSLRLGAVHETASPEGYTVSFEISQSDTAPYLLDLPVRVIYAGGAETRTVRIEKETELVTVDLKARPAFFEIDPEYRVFRILTDAEVPPSLAGFFGDKDGVIIVPKSPEANAKYLKTAQTISSDYAIRMMSDSGNIKDYLRERSVFIFGGKGENALFSAVEPYISKELHITDSDYKVAGKVFARSGTILAVAVRNPFNPSKTLCFFTSDAPVEKINENGRRLRYFSDSSYLVFTPDGKVEKGAFAGEKVLRHDFNGQ